MADDLNSFSKRIKTIAQGIERNVDKQVIKTAILASQAVITATPVDTGRARSNWLASAGTSINEPIDREERGANTTLSENNAAISSRKSGQNVYISNNLPYIKRLNEGYSQQAPAMFVEKAVQTAVSFLKNVKVLP